MSDGITGGLGIKRYLQPEQRARYERRLKAWQEDHEEDADPDHNERAILWMLMELKQAEEIIASLLHQRDEERMKAAAECLRLIRIAESAEQQRDEYKGKWNDVLEHEDKTLALARKLEAQLREKERELAAARSAAFREAAQICEDEGAREACAVAEILRVKAAEKDHLTEPRNLISKDGQDGKCAPEDGLCFAGCGMRRDDPSHSILNCKGSGAAPKGEEKP